MFGFGSDSTKLNVYLQTDQEIIKKGCYGRTVRYRTVRRVIDRQFYKKIMVQTFFTLIYRYSTVHCLSKTHQSNLAHFLKTSHYKSKLRITEYVLIKYRTVPYRYRTVIPLFFQKNTNHTKL